MISIAAVYIKKFPFCFFWGLPVCFKGCHLFLLRAVILFLLKASLFLLQAGVSFEATSAPDPLAPDPLVPKPLVPELLAPSLLVPNPLASKPLALDSLPLNPWALAFVDEGPLHREGTSLTFVL